MNTKPEYRQVHEVTGLRVERLHTFPPSLQVAVAGTVQSSGWTNPQLIPFTYVQPPPDGVYDYYFVATPPDGGIVSKVISPIRLRTELPAGGVNGIRIHSATNSLEEIFNPQPAPAAQV